MITYEKIRRYGWLMALVLVAFNAPGIAEEMKHAEPVTDAAALELSISADGRSIVDQGGNEIARFKEGMQVRPAKAGTAKLQGCMCCEKSCIIYDEHGKCIKYINSCTWDFDCSCRK